MNFLKDIVKEFVVEGTISDIKPYGSGHIHDTFRVNTLEPDSHDYILQKLNNHVFKNIDQLQHNIALVTNHIREKLISQKKRDLTRTVLTLIPTRAGKTYFLDERDNYWRLYIFISDHKSFDIVQSLEHAIEGGKAIGNFQALLADLDSSTLHETIPYFHNIEKRLDAFNNSVSEDCMNRAREAEAEINFVKARASEMGVILNLGREGIIPTRITHNDTKFNNILLDRKDKALCVIDLDTVMPGFIHYDFGDAIRTTACRCAEDEKDLSKVELDIELFEAYSKGYLSEIGSFLTDSEIKHLAFAPRLVTFTIGLRFLTDHLDGDKYFKIHHKDHNLERARTQFKLVESNERQYKIMQSIISNLSNNYVKHRK